MMEKTPKERADTMMPASITPINISGKAFFGLIPNNQAAKVPVQAPVTGRGMPTNKIKAKSPHLACFL